MKQFEKILWKTKQKLALSKQKWLLTAAIVVATATAAAALYSPPNRESEAAAALRKQKAKIELTKAVKAQDASDASASSATQGSAVTQGAQGVTLYSWSEGTTHPDTVVAIADGTTVSSVTVDTTEGYTASSGDSVGLVRFHAELPTAITGKTGYNAGNYNYKFSETSGDGIGLNDTVTFIQGTTKNDFFLKFEGTYEAPNDSVGFTLGYGYKVAIDTVNAKGDNLTSYNFTENGSGAAVDSGKFNVTIVNSLNAADKDTAAHNYVYKYTVGFWKGTTEHPAAVGDTTITGLDSAARISTSSLTFSLGFRTDTTDYDSIQVHIDAKRISPFVTLVDSSSTKANLTDSVLRLNAPTDTTYTITAKPTKKGTFSFKGAGYQTASDADKVDVTGESQSSGTDSVYQFKITQDTTIYVFYKEDAHVYIDSTVTDRGFTFLNGNPLYPDDGDSVRFALQPTATTTKAGTWQLLNNDSNPVDTIDVDGIDVGTFNLRLVPKGSSPTEKDTIIVKNVESDTTLKIKYVPTYDTAVVKKTNESYIKELKVLTEFIANTDSSGYVKDGKLTFTATLGEPDTIRGGHYGLFSKVDAATGDTISGFTTDIILGKDENDAYTGIDTIKITAGINRDTAFYVKYYPKVIPNVAIKTGQNLEPVDTAGSIVDNDDNFGFKVKPTGGKLYGTYSLTDTTTGATIPGLTFIPYVTYGTEEKKGTDSITIKGITADTAFTINYTAPLAFTIIADSGLNVNNNSTIIPYDTSRVNGKDSVIYKFKATPNAGSATDSVYQIVFITGDTPADSSTTVPTGVTIEGPTLVAPDSVFTITVHDTVTLLQKVKVAYVEISTAPSVYNVDVTKGTGVKAIVDSAATTTQGDTYLIVAQLGTEEPDTIKGGRYALFGGDELDSIPANGNVDDGAIKYTITHGVDLNGAYTGLDSIRVEGISTDTALQVRYYEPDAYTVAVIAGTGVKAIVDSAETVYDGQDYSITVQLGNAQDTLRRGTYALFGNGTDSIPADGSLGGTITYSYEYGDGDSGTDVITVKGISKDTVLTVKYYEPEEFTVTVTAGDNVDEILSTDTKVRENYPYTIVTLLDTVTGGTYALFGNGTDSIPADASDGGTITYTTTRGVDDEELQDTITVWGIQSDTALTVKYYPPVRLDTTITLTAGRGLTGDEIEGDGAVTDGRADFIITPLAFGEDSILTFTYEGQELDESTTPAVRVVTDDDNDLYLVEFSKVEDIGIDVTVTYTAPEPDHYPTHVTIAKGSTGDTIQIVAISEPDPDQPGFYTITGRVNGLIDYATISLEYWDVTAGILQDSLIENSGIQGSAALLSSPPVAFAGEVLIPANLPATIDSVEVRVFYRPAPTPPVTYPAVKTIAGDSIATITQPTATDRVDSVKFTGEVTALQTGANFTYTVTGATSAQVEVSVALDEPTGTSFTGYVVLSQGIIQDTVSVTVSYKLPTGTIPVVVESTDQSATITDGGSGVGTPNATYTFKAKRATGLPAKGYSFKVLFADNKQFAYDLPWTKSADSTATGDYTFSFTVPDITAALNVIVSYVEDPLPTVRTTGGIDKIGDVVLKEANVYTVQVTGTGQADYQLVATHSGDVSSVGLSKTQFRNGTDTALVTITTTGSSADVANINVLVAYIDVEVPTNINVVGGKGINSGEIVPAGQGSVINGAYKFTVTPQIPGGKLVVVLKPGANSTKTEIGDSTDRDPDATQGNNALDGVVTITGPTSKGVYNVDIAGLLEDVTANVSYTNPALKYELHIETAGVQQDSVKPASDQVSTGKLDVYLKLGNNVDKGGNFTFIVYDQPGGSIIDDIAISTTATSDTTYKTVISKIYVTQLYIVAGYTTPPEVAAPATPTPPADNDYIAELPQGVTDSTPEGTLAVAPTNVSLPSDVNRTDIVTLVPGEEVTAIVEVVIPPLATRQTIVLTFTGSLANEVEPLTIYNFPINKTEIKVVYKFVSSLQDIFGTRGIVLRAAATTSYAEYNEDTNTITIYLIDIDVAKLGKDVANVLVNIQDGAYVGTSDHDVVLYNHPIYLVPDNGVPSIGYKGFFSLAGDFPNDGTLVYRLQNDNATAWKSYTTKTGILDSEIERLANGELLYFALKGQGAPDRVFVYKPNTYADVGGGNVEAPQLARNVNVHAASVSEGLISFTAVSGQWISTDGSFSFIVTPANPIPGYVLTLQFYTKEWITVTNKPTVEGNEIPNEDGTFTVTLKGVKVSDLQVVVTYTQGGEVGNANVDNDKVWSNNGTLFINSITNSIAKVYNINGGLVKSVKVDANTLTTAELPQGVYIVTLNGKTTKVNTK